MLQLIKLHFVFLITLLFLFSWQTQAGKKNNPYSSWALFNHQASINLPNLDTKGLKKDVTVAVIDSGVDVNHPYLRSNIIISKDNQSIEDLVGHGTHVAGIIKSVFPNVKILPIKYFDPKASDFENLYKTIDAINLAVKMNVDIINYSAGGSGSSKEEQKALENARDHGILVIVAAGNDGRDIDLENNHYYPANYNLNNLITVINHDELVHLSNTSNFGKNSTHISAPGNRIKSSYPNLKTGYLSGTSQATAFVTGVAALIKAYQPTLTYLDIKNIILKSSKKEKSLEGKCLTGAKVDAASALMMAQSYVRKVSFMP